MADPQLRLLFSLCDSAGLSRDDRLELAEVMLNIDVPSFKVLEPEHVVRLLDALRGFVYISHLKSTVPPEPQSEGHCL